MHARYRAARTLLTAALLVLTTSHCIGPLAVSSQPTPEELSPAATLGSYRPGMNLRQTFDSLSATAHPARIELLNENVEAWVARWQIIAAARSTIDIDYFIFSQDIFGLALLGHLVEKARQGVRVRLQVDAQGMIMSESPYGLDCMPFVAGVRNFSVRLHRSLTRRLFESIVQLEPTLATASDHDKVIVVDGRTSVVGGRNIAAKYFAHPDDLPEAFHDVDIALEGAGVGETLTQVFETTYESQRVIPVSAADVAPCAAALRSVYESMDTWLAGRPLAAEAARTMEGTETSWAKELERWPRLKGAAVGARNGARIEAETRILDSVPRPGSAADAVTRSLVRLFEASTATVLMESPYVVLTEGAASMLEATGERNVEMKLLTNSPLSTDNTLSQIYFREQWPRLLAAVPRLRLFACGTTHNIHSKFVVFDDQVTLVGSYNLDPFSMLVSGEIAVAAWSREFAEHIAVRPRVMIARGAPEVYEYKIGRDAAGHPVLENGIPRIEFGPADHTDAGEGPLYGFRWTLLRAVPWLAGLPPFF
jgi:phosphatidylserine/phosphatidylglycerophosphate/cardiolipin synthase-like enzyme